MSGYVATVNTPGYLPQDDEPPVFDTAREAWEYLADQREREEEDSEPDAPADQELSDTYHELWLHRDEPGTVYGPTPGYQGSHDLGLAYCVTPVDS